MPQSIETQQIEAQKNFFIFFDFYLRLQSV